MVLSLQTLCILKGKKEGLLDHHDVYDDWWYLLGEDVRMEYLECSLYDKVPEIGRVFTGCKKNNLIYGNIQSGKTRVILSFMWYVIYKLRMCPVVVLRNLKVDRYQFIQRINEYNKNVICNRDYYIKANDILILLNNKDNYGKIDRLDKEYVLLIDEADLLYKTKRRLLKVEKKYDEYKQTSRFNILFTATPLGIFNLWDVVEDSVLNVVSMNKNINNYYGITSLEYGECNTREHEYWKEPLDEFYGRERGLLLITTEYLKQSQYRLSTNIMEYVNNTNKRVCIMIHNANGIVFRNVMVRNRIKNINRAIQYAYDRMGYDHIIIISKRLASRGISYVSSDYRFHITDQIFRKTKGGDRMMQNIRCCGIYDTADAPKLWTTGNCMRYLFRMYEKVEREVEYWENRCNNNRIVC